jgi:hypothetical protein
VSLFKRDLGIIVPKAWCGALPNGSHADGLLSNLVFEGCWSCGDLVGFGFNSVFEFDACDDFGEVVKAA